MSESNQLVIYDPLDGESLNHYLERYSTEETQKIFEAPEKLSQLCRVLFDTPWPTETEESDRSLEKIWAILRRTDNFRVLLQHIRMWEPTREDLLNLLVNSAEELRTISKWCAGGRFIGCALESGSIVAGLFLQDTGSNYANWMLHTATFFGALGLGSTVLEMKMTHGKFRRMMELIERDQRLFVPIQNFYQQTKELEEAMLDIFPFELTEKIVRNFTNFADDAIDPVELLSDLLTTIAEQGPNRLRDIHLIRNIVQFIRCPNSGELCNRILFRRKQHPVVIDIARMLLQLYYSPLKYLCCQSIKALSPEYQNFHSLPVWGRIALNGYSIVDTICIWNQEVPGTFEMNQLYTQLKGELDALKEIINISRPRRN